jgi:hypothetical protein
MATTRKASPKKSKSGGATPKRSLTVGSARRRGAKSSAKKTKGRASAPKSSQESSRKTSPTGDKAHARTAARKKTPAKGKGLKERARVAEQLRQYQTKGKAF